MAHLAGFLYVLHSFASFFSFSFPFLSHLKKKVASFDCFAVCLWGSSNSPIFSISSFDLVTVACWVCAGWVWCFIPGCISVPHSRHRHLVGPLPSFPSSSTSSSNWAFFNCFISRCV